MRGDEEAQRWVEPLVKMMHAAGLDDRLYDFYEQATLRAVESTDEHSDWAKRAWPENPAYGKVIDLVRVGQLIIDELAAVVASYPRVPPP